MDESGNLQRRGKRLLDNGHSKRYSIFFFTCIPVFRNWRVTSIFSSNSAIFTIQYFLLPYLVSVTTGNRNNCQGAREKSRTEKYLPEENYDRSRYQKKYTNQR